MSLEAALGERIGVSDEECALIGPLLPPEHGGGCRPAGDNRRYFEGMMWMARSGAQWRLLPDEYGKWESVFRHYQRWVEMGMFVALPETLATSRSARSLSESYRNLPRVSNVKLPTAPAR
ncbi:transposase [Sphingomonas koreensis]|nr:transposase [Sphingomonas koreensis]